MYREIILSVFLISFMAVGVAQNRDYEVLNSGGSLEYGSSFTASVNCTGEGCPTGSTSFDLDMCGDKAGDYDTGRLGSVNFPVDISFEVPGDAPCSLGTKDIYVNDSLAGKLTIDPKGGMNPNQGERIIAEFDNSLNNVRSFLLTNDGSDGILMEQDAILGDSSVVANSSLGFLDANLNDVMDQCPIGSGSTALCDNIGNIGFGGVNSHELSQSDYLSSLGSATPLHTDGGSYSLSKDILYGSKMKNSDGKFYLCRNGQNNEPVSLNRNGYRKFNCNSGSWNEKWADIRVDFYDADPNSEEVGFKISSSQVKNTWQDIYETDPLSDNSESGKLVVEGSCWQGSQNQRPNDDSKLTKFRKTLKSSGDTIVVMDVPDRTGNLQIVESNDFSCIYGFKLPWKTEDPLFDTVYNGTVVQGSDSIYPIKSSTGNAGNVSDLSQSRLLKAKQNTGNPTNLYGQFPSNNKNPLIDYND